MNEVRFELAGIPTRQRRAEQRRTVRRIAAAVLAVVPLVACAALITWLIARNTLPPTQDATARAAAARLRTQLADEQRALASTNVQLRSTDRRLGALRASLSGTRDQVSGQANAIVSLEHTVRALRAPAPITPTRRRHRMRRRR